MIFDTSIPEIKKKAINRIKHLLDKNAKIEVLEKKNKRTYSQNNYLHLILSYYAIEYGETMEYVKQIIFKQWVNEDLFKTEFVNKKTGEIREAWRSTADLNTKEMSQATERFRNYSVKSLGLYIPEPKDIVHLEEIENYIEENKIYL
ncbi:hypothetical protein EGI16_10765 [Chryseobacterium sp. G0240]|uniref:hypothetical protein n=1 Tax=Chryseobacterium sp. G0240 TaxID=2487066 RepID=UPI000F454FD4|nr:hypothetical protein [Chryseobacterium sp. G0240]ROI03687.1 hypothetical protein EGI16_10765 [Chryseobacterium sp. G0240]